MLSKVLAVELAPNKITVNAIGPGFINTPMTADIQKATGFMKRLVNRVPLGQIGEPVDVANTALFLASEEGRYYTGSILHPDGGVVMQ
jgi:NAD(P)-dependent dehydrogenase (short-subunit alcohol dehydrogenase family)